MTVHRRTFRSHASYMALRGPAMALSVQMASFVAIKSLGATEREAIAVSFALPIGHLLGIFWAHVLARRYRVPFAFWPDLIGFLLLMPIVFVDSPRVFVALIFGTIILRASTIVALSGIIRDNYSSDSRAATMGKVQAASLATMAVSGLVFGYLLEADSNAYRWLYPASAVLGIVAVIQLRKIPEANPADRVYSSEPSIWDFAKVLRDDRDFLRYQISFMAFGFAALMYTALLPLYLAQDLDVSYKSGAVALVVIQFALPMLTSPLWGRLIDRANVLMLRGVFNLVWALCPILVFLFHSVEGVMIGQVMVGLIQGGSVLVWNLGINIFARKHDVPKYMGVHQALTGIRGLVAPLVGLWLAVWLAGDSPVPDYRTVFLLCGLVMIAAGLYMLWESQMMQRRGKAVTFQGAEQQNA